MRDYHIPVSVAVPAAIGFLGVLWLLRKKSGSGNKTAPKALHQEENQFSKVNDKYPLDQNEKGIIQSQRNAPDNQAFDRGSSDLQLKLFDLPQVITTEVCSVSDRLGVESSTDVGVGQDKSEVKATVNQCDDGHSRTSEREHLTAMADVLQEAYMNLSDADFSSEPLYQVPCDSTIQLSSCKHYVGSQVVGLSAGSQPATTLPEVILDQLQIATPSSDTQTSVQPHIQTKHTGTGDGETFNVDRCNSHRKDAATVLTEDQVAVTLLQQTLHVPTLQQVIATSPGLLSSDSGLQSDTEVYHINSQGQLDISDTFSRSNSQFHGETTSSTPLMSLEDTFCTSRTHPVTTNKELPCDVKETTLSVCPGMPQVSSSIDILSSEEIESIWNIESCINSNFNPSASLASALEHRQFSNVLPTNTSFSDSDNPVTVSSSNVKEQDIDSAVEDDQVTDNAVEDDQGTVATPSQSDKDNSPAKSSSPACDSNSEGSNDSGRGGSEHDVAYQARETLVHFQFTMPSSLCGRFIGKHGKNINYLKSKTGAHVSLTNNPCTPDHQICQIVGSQFEVDDVLAMIRRKFPVHDYPLLTLNPVNMPTPSPVTLQPDQQLILSDVMQLSLPEGVSVDVFVSAIVDAGHLFVQQPTHQSYMSLEKLNYFLGVVYSQDSNVPCVPTPVESGIICVCENDGFWYRAMIVTAQDENNQVQVKFVDYGGYAEMTVSSLKQIRADFMSLPFQAVECFMANITTNQNEGMFSDAATLALSEMTRGKLLQCQVVARTESGSPYIHLYQINTESNSAVMINRALVNSRLVRWIEIL